MGSEEHGRSADALANPAELKLMQNFEKNRPRLGFRCRFAGIEKERRQVIITNKPIEESGGAMPIYGVDLQPHTLKSLAMDSLLEIFPNMTDLDAWTLKNVGTPPLMVDEIAQHKLRDSDVSRE